MPRKTTPLKLIIVRQGLVQADVAHAAGISESRLSRLVTGRASPHEYEIKNLSNVLNVAREDLNEKRR